LFFFLFLLEEKTKKKIQTDSQMASGALLVLLLVTFVGFCIGQAIPIVNNTATIVAPQFTVTVALFTPANNPNVSHPHITWQQSLSRNPNAEVYAASLFSIVEGVTNSSNNYFEPLGKFGGFGFSTLSQRWAFTSEYITNTSATIILTASAPLYRAPSFYQCSINITVLLKDTKDSNSFQAGSIILRAPAYHIMYNNKDTQIAVGYVLVSNHSSFDQTNLKIKSNVFQMGGAYLGVSNANEVLGIEQWDANAELPDPNDSRNWGLAYYAISNFPQNYAFVQQVNFGFGTGTKSHTGAIVAVVIILVIIIVAVAVVAFIIFRRRKRAYSAL